MTYIVWPADEGEHDGGAKTYPRKPTIKPGTAFNRWALDATDAATIYADYFHSQRDGWESSWPRDFCVRDTETGTVQRFEVDREHVPEFHAGRGVEVKPGPHDHENLPEHDECPCGHPFGFQGPCPTAADDRWRSRCTCGDPPVTADTITAEQILMLRKDYNIGSISYEWCQLALTPNSTHRFDRVYTTLEARARCAEILNARSMIESDGHIRGLCKRPRGGGQVKIRPLTATRRGKVDVDLFAGGGGASDGKRRGHTSGSPTPAPSTRLVSRRSDRWRSRCTCGDPKPAATP